MLLETLLTACTSTDAKSDGRPPRETAVVEVHSSVGDGCADVPASGSVVVSPAPAFPFDELHCAYVPDDPGEGWTMAWEIHGQTVGAREALPPTGLPAGTEVRCVVVPDRSECPVSASVTLEAPPHPGNVLLVIADDIGADNLEIYGLGVTYPQTPTIDQLAEEGVRFQRAYANPICSAARSTLQTGRFSHRTGVTDFLVKSDTWGLQLEETTLPEMLAGSPAGPYASSYAGKWHLGGGLGADHPVQSGYEWYAGTLIGLNLHPDGTRESYWDWQKTTNGVTQRHADGTYLTTDTVDDALARMAVMPEPWLLVVGLNAPHEPLHEPPAGLWSGVPVGGTPDIAMFHAMIEAMDTELGRLLAGLEPELDARTTVIFVGDNGAWEPTISPPLDPLRGKGTPFEGGTHVPLVIRGPLVGSPGRVSHELVNQADLFPTIADLAQVQLTPEQLSELDGISTFRQLRDPSGTHAREVAYTERYGPVGLGPWTTGFRTAQDLDWKMIEEVDGTVWLFDMRGAWHEATFAVPVPYSAEQQAGLERLQAALPFSF